jgi:carbonic anhydrase
MKKVFSLIVMGIVVLSTFSGCKSNTNSQTNNHAIASEDDCTHAHWGYTGEEAPEKWVDLCSGYSACGQKSQSPVNITGVKEDKTLSAIGFDYSTTPVEIVNNGHTIQFSCAPGSKLSIGDTQYELLQFHYHGLSEHEVEGEHYQLEVHFVHKATDDNYAVVGLFIEEGEENPLFSSFLSHFPHEKGTYENLSTSLELSTFFPENKSYYHYSGSLTTPPCSEVVNWYVLKNTITASADQISEFQHILHNNYRPVQELNDRTIALYSE